MYGMHNRIFKRFTLAVVLCSFAAAFSAQAQQALNWRVAGGLLPADGAKCAVSGRRH